MGRRKQSGTALRLCVSLRSRLDPRFAGPLTAHVLSLSLLAVLAAALSLSLLAARRATFHGHPPRTAASAAASPPSCPPSPPQRAAAEAAEAAEQETLALFKAAAMREDGRRSDK